MCSYKWCISLFTRPNYENAHRVRFWTFIGQQSEHCRSADGHCPMHTAPFLWDCSPLGSQRHTHLWTANVERPPCSCAYRRRTKFRPLSGCRRQWRTARHTQWSSFRTSCVSAQSSMSSPSSWRGRLGPACWWRWLRVASSRNPALGRSPRGHSRLRRNRCLNGLAISREWCPHRLHHEAESKLPRSACASHIWWCFWWRLCYNRRHRCRPHDQFLSNCRGACRGYSSDLLIMIQFVISYTIKAIMNILIPILNSI